MTPSRPRQSRPTICPICSSPMRQPAQGRPRLTCSDVCRQRQRRGPKSADAEWRKSLRESERIMKIWELRFGPFDKRKYEWAMTERERLLLYMRNNWQISFCRTCQRPYIPDGSGSSRGSLGGSDVAFCSRKCSKDYAHLHERIATLPEHDRVTIRLMRPLRECRHCGALFLPRNYRQKYHEAACRVRAYRARVAKLPICVECGGKIIRLTKSGTVKYCSDSCRRQVRNREARIRDAQNRPAPVVRPCEGCGIEFTVPKHGGSKTRYHSLKCRLATHRREERKIRAARPCRRCGDEFVPIAPRNGNQAYCDPCRKIRAKRVRTNDLTYRRRLREAQEREAAEKAAA